MNFITHSDYPVKTTARLALPLARRSWIAGSDTFSNTGHAIGSMRKSELVSDVPLLAVLTGKSIRTSKGEVLHSSMWWPFSLLPNGDVLTREFGLI